MTRAENRPAGNRAANTTGEVNPDTTGFAHELHQQGFHVFPLDHPAQPGCIGKHGKTSPCDGDRGKHPAVKWGVWSVTVTAQMIDLEWAKHGGVANIGIACGPSNLVVLDEDRHGELDRWCVAYGIALPVTYTVTTGRGRHLHFRWDHTTKRISNSPKAMNGFTIDVRGHGGFVVAEGSQHASGAVYTGNGHPVADLPDDVAQLLLAGSTTEASAEATRSEPDRGIIADHTGKIAFHDRHNALIKYAGRLRNSGLTRQEVEPAFPERWLYCEQPVGEVPEAHFHSPACPYPVTEDEALAKLADVFGRYPAGTGSGDDEGDGDGAEGFIQQRMTVLRANREANRRLDAEERPPIILPPVKGLSILLAEPDTPARYRIDRVAPEGGRVLISAQYKAGKTTLTGNLLRSLVDGDDFLGTFTVDSPAKHAVLIDTEMSENTMRRWLRDQNIVSTDAVADVIALRGKVSTFNLLDESCRAAWAARLRELGCDYLILDCLRPVLDALGLDENRDAGKFLVAFDALMADAGIPDAAIVQHMGHANERARGDSRLQDWPDAIWRIVRETEEPDSARYFSAYGRDVDVHEGRLSFDPQARRLAYSTGSRLDSKAEAARGDIIGLLAKSDQGLSKNATENDPALAEHARKPIRAGLKKAIEDGFVTVEDGPHRSKLHRINHRANAAECQSRAGERDTYHAPNDPQFASSPHLAASSPGEVMCTTSPVRQFVYMANCERRTHSATRGSQKPRQFANPAPSIRTGRK